MLRSASLRLPPHWLGIALHTVNANREAVFEGEVLRVSREDGDIVATNNMEKLPFELTVPISSGAEDTSRDGHCGVLILLPHPAAATCRSDGDCKASHCPRPAGTIRK